MKIKFTPPLLYVLALSFLIAAASIAPPLDPYKEARFDYSLCSSLAEQLPCDEVPGTWLHICKASVSVSCSGLIQAIELSRHIPHHVVSFIQPVISGGAERAATIVHCLVWSF
mmetsp:Transcript_12788/g.35442  ORF Transcript_12788/g.35442 Transcript_12788/m.35442 type:complete len:113 (-) Transcript_12788:272-610(-)